MSAFKIQFNTGLMGRRNTCRFILIRECTIEGLPSADLPLCVVGNLEWKKREAARGTMGREKIKERPFPLSPPSSPLPPPPARIQFFVYICYFYWDTQWESLRRRGPEESNMGTDIGEFKIRLRLRPDFLDTWWQRKQKLWEWIRLKNCGNIPEKVWEGKITQILWTFWQPERAKWDFPR